MDYLRAALALLAVASLPAAANARYGHSFASGIEHAFVYEGARIATEHAIRAGEDAYRGRGTRTPGGRATGTVANPMSR